MDMTKANELVPQSAFDSKLLDRDHHDRLIADLKRVAKKAGVPMSAVWTPLSSACQPGADYEWVRNMRRSEDGGLVYVGKSIGASIDDRMRAITGACLRNYTDARMMSLQDVLKRVKDDSMPDCTVLLIPNFCLDKADGGDIPSWEVQHLLGLLIDRATAGKKTVLYISSWATLEKQYGSAFMDHLSAYFATMQGGKYAQAKVGELVAA